MTSLWINSFHVDWQRGEVVVNDQVRSVEPRAMAVLRVLVNAQGGVVTQQVLLDEVWNDVVVAPNAIQRCIAQLRKVFNDDAKQQSVIKTHPKIGYSLIATMSNHEPVLQMKRPSSPSHFTLAITLVVIVMLVALASLTYNSAKTMPESLSKVTMITSDDDSQHGAVIINDTLFYIKGSASNTQQLISKNLQSNVETVLLSKQWFEGGLGADEASGILYYSAISLKEKKKCSTIMALNIESLQKHQVVACANGFSFNPQSITTDKLVYLRREANEAPSLIVRRIQEGTDSVINHDLGDVKRLAVDGSGSNIALVTQKGNSYYLHFAVLNAHSLVVQQRWTISKQAAMSRPTWQSSHRLLMTDTQSIEWFTADGEHGVLALPSKDTLFSAMSYDDRLVVELGRDDWDITQTSLTDVASSEPKSRSIYAEYAASYRPIFGGYSFISLRSGSPQLWLSHQGKLVKLTVGHKSVDSYVWSVTGDLVAVVSEGQLTTIDVSGVTTPIVLSAEVQAVYQWYVGDNNQPMLLASVMSNSVKKLASINLETHEVAVISSREIQWAQRIANKTYITNTTDGYLQRITKHHGQESVELLDETKTLKLQWRFFYRAGGLYFQDKAKHIWRYDPLNSLVKTVGHYDERSLLLTDIDIQQRTFLSDVLVKQTRDLAFID